MDKMKKSTDNLPLLDDVVFYLKRLCTECVIKRDSQANKYETEGMATSAYRYLCAVDNSADFYLYSYRKDEMIVAGVPNDILDKAYIDLKYVPKNSRKIMLENKKEEIRNSYIEGNAYYKTLNGQPLRTEDVIHLFKEDIPRNIRIKDINKPLHLFEDSELDLLYHYGVIDRLKSMYPDLKYLDYLGSKRISIYKARKASNNTLLYIPDDIPHEIVERFKEKLALNKVYVDTVVHSDAYAFKSEHYEDVLTVLMLVLTMTDIISEIPDMINKNEFFDLKMIKVIFDNYDVAFFSEIPFRYQIAMVKSLNKLLKFKSTTLNILDICSIFGFDNIRVFKYYLLKEHKMVDGRYVIQYDENTYDYDYDKMFDLKFVKVPINESITKYLNNPHHHIDYDTVTKRDPIWDGGLNHDYIKREIIKQEFNHYYTKYISVDVLNSVTNLSFQMSYFYNILFDDHLSESKLEVRVNSIKTNADFKLVDILCLLYALGYRYLGVKDTIFSKHSQVIHVMGFNFEQDMNTLAAHFANKKYTLKDLGVDTWMNPEEIVSVNQLVKVYINNKSIHDHLVYEMNHAESKSIYDVYKKLYDSLMVTTLSGKFFTMSDGNVAETYTEFIQDRDLRLYKLLMSVDEMTNREEKKLRITELINNIVDELDAYINEEELDYVFSIYPTVSRDAIRDYVWKVIEFFKSYKIDIDTVNTLLKFDDRLNSKVRILDEFLAQKTFEFHDKIVDPDPDPDDPDNPKPVDPNNPDPNVPGGGDKDTGDIATNDMIGRIISIFNTRDEVQIKDFVTILAIKIKDILFGDYFNDIIDEIEDIHVTMSFKDYATIEPKIKYMVNFLASSTLDMYDKLSLVSKLFYIEDFRLQDNVIMVKVNIKDIFIKEEDFFIPMIESFNTNLSLYEPLDIMEEVEIKHINI